MNFLANSKSNSIELHFPKKRKRKVSRIVDAHSTTTTMSTSGIVITIAFHCHSSTGRLVALFPLSFWQATNVYMCVCVDARCHQDRCEIRISVDEKLGTSRFFPVSFCRFSCVQSKRKKKIKNEIEYRIVNGMNSLNWSFYFVRFVEEKPEKAEEGQRKKMKWKWTRSEAKKKKKVVFSSNALPLSFCFVLPFFLARSLWIFCGNAIRREGRRTYTNNWIKVHIIHRAPLPRFMHCDQKWNAMASFKSSDCNDRRPTTKQQLLHDTRHSGECADDARVKKIVHKHCQRCIHKKKTIFEREKSCSAWDESKDQHNKRRIKVG